MVGKFGSALLAVLAFGVALTGPRPAVFQGRVQTAAAQSQTSIAAIKQIMRIVDALETQAQRMTVEMALLVLSGDASAGTGFNLDSSLARLGIAHDYFEQLLGTLANGDKSIGLSAPSDPSILRALAELRAAWDIHKHEVGQVLERQRATRANLAVSAQLDKSVIDAASKTKKVFEDKLLKNKLISIDVLTLIKAEHQSFLIEKMAKNYLLIAVGYDAEKQRVQLAESAKRFDRVLNGLIGGDSQLQLMPARDAHLRAELSRVVYIWVRVKPQLDAAARNGKPDGETLKRVKSDMETLFQGMKKSVDIIEKL